MSFPASAMPMPVEAPASMSLVDALRHADRLEDEERVEEALSIWQQILRQMPDEPNAMRGIARVLGQRGRIDDAIAALCQALDRTPDALALWLDLSNVLTAAGRMPEAAEALRRALLVDPQSAARHNDFGIACMQCGDYERAEAVFRAGLALEGERAALNLNLAQVLYLMGRPDDAVAHARVALQHDANERGAYKLLAQSLVASGDRAAAADVLRAWQARMPDDAEVAHQLAACGAGDMPARADDGYVRRVFDDFADGFERRLAQLGYHGPQVIGACVAGLASELPPDAALLDAGCGTGWGAPMLRPHAARLDGVDLSAGMLARAREHGYDALHEAELTAYLAGCGPAYDLIACADTLCYFGDLHEVLRAAQGALRGPALLVFSAEALPDDAPAPVQLNPHGRYAHRRDHVTLALAAAGFTVRSLAQHDLRRELAQTIRGWIVVAQRAG